MTNFNGNFVVETDSVYLGDGFPIFTLDAVADKARSYGSAVKLDKGEVKNYPFGVKMVDPGADNGVDGFIYRGICYGEDGKTVVGKTELVMTKGLIVIPIDTSLQNAEIGAAVHYVNSDGKFKASGGSVVGRVASGVFKAKSLEKPDLVDAVYLDIDIARA